ncbi:uncharacterized protein JCM10292_002473 [Rhodotorula paludigena]|uniref:uncharacterized protein n=1 Tax=Rhodotorula paludigena TaxID=86838 RepID=UPI00316D5F8C
MEPNASPGPSQDGQKPVRAKRTYRACQPCRARKLKCDLGDPDNPSDPPCRRCRRESRECVFVVRANAKTYIEPSGDSGAPYTSVAPQRPPRKGAATGAGSDSPAAEPPQALPARTAAHPYASPHVGGWSTGPSTSRQPYPSPASAAATLAASTTPNSETQQPPASSYYYQHATASGPPTPGGYDPNRPHLRHLAQASRAATTPEQPNHPTHSTASLDLDDEDGDRGDGLDDDEDENMSADTPERRDSIDPTGRGGPSDANVLLSSTLHNPSDALKLLATASSLRSLSASVDASSSGAESRPGRPTSASTSALSGKERGPSRERRVSGGGATGSAAPGTAAALNGKGKEKEVDSPASELQGAGWERWVPVKEGMVTIAEAEALLAFFENHMSPLYPLLSPRIFHATHLPALTSRESLLLASMVSISARHSALPSAPRARAIHSAVADYIRDELIGLLDGSGELRHISSVEALLLLTEWPPIADGRAATGRSASGRPGKRKRGWGGGDGPGDEGENGEASDEDAEALLRSSAQYDGMSWSLIGCAVRLAQELGIHNLYFGPASIRGPVNWEEERCLRTWIYCYNADRHVSVRLGRNAVVQSYMSSSWWEQVTSHLSHGVRREGAHEVWAERTLPQGLIAALMGTIQERLYPNKEITRSMLRTGHWESFIRSLDHELQMMLLKSRTVLQQGSVESTLLQMEFEYVRLYGNAIALRALQERLRRAVKANDLWFVSPSLLNLQEGQWCLDALAAAQSILDRTVNYLAPKGYLRVAPSRIFQRILFAATFLFKALAVGVVEHGQSKVMGLLDEAITALHTNATDRQHISRGFAALLRRLQAQCKPTLLARFGVRPTQNGESGEPSRIGTPVATRPSSPRPDAAAGNGAASAPPASAADPALAPTPTPGQSVPPSMNNTPRAGYHPLPGGPGAASMYSPAMGLHPLPPGYPPSTVPFHAAAHLHGSPAFPGAHSAGAAPWALPTLGEPTTDFGGFKLGDAPAGLDPLTGNALEWDSMSSSIAMGREQDMLFQSLWGSGAGPAGGSSNDFGFGAGAPALNLFGTLVGEDFELNG